MKSTKTVKKAMEAKSSKQDISKLPLNHFFRWRVMSKLGWGDTVYYLNIHGKTSTGHQFYHPKQWYDMEKEIIQGIEAVIIEEAK